ncbi:MAG: heparan-alpha-glucosaminide N-acetyltransferase, partial [Flavobacteriaceae bacterium]|nr:heparan-alpha-glucosaminide N-acetyltransferase [Muriicola sp.]NNL40409.1 heparan-alpha-glucosaminide N-acetyltransferase [Flavobacteriaceae bacterium]
AFTISFPFFKDFAEIRFPGVLQRIGVVFFFAAVLFLNFNWKVILGITITILVGYWVWLGFIPLNGEVPTFERAPNNWANFVDLQVFGTHMYKEDYDPEGLLSTFPSIASSLLGIFTGLILISQRAKKELLLLLLGILMLLLGYIWDLAFPINKALWSSSFVLVTAGWANIFLALIYYLTDVKGIQFGSIFKYTGANAITVYFLSSFVTKLFYSIQVEEGLSLHGWIYKNIYVHSFLSGEVSSLLYGLSVMGFYLLLALFMYRRKIFIKV